MSITSVNFNITNGIPPFDFSVKDSNGVERFIDYIGNKINFNAITNGVYVVKITKGTCVISNQITVINCSGTPVIGLPSSPNPPPVAPCIGITNLNIVGLSSVKANGTGQYTVSYTGDKPLNYTWQISGQGTQIISGSNADTVNFKFGSSSNFILYLSVTDKCGTVVSATKELTLIPTVDCDITISNIVIDCVANNNNTVTVSANSPSGKTLRYGILGFKAYQISNVFNLVNSDSSGYTFLVAEFNNEVNCVTSQNRMVTCLTPSPPPATSPAPIASSNPVPTVCDIKISNLAVECTSTTSSRVSVFASSSSGKRLQYGILGFATYRTSNIFDLGNSDSNGYTFIVSEVNNESCNNTMNRVINCNTIPNPTPNPTPIVGCPTITFILGNETISGNDNYSRMLVVSGGSGSYTPHFSNLRTGDPTINYISGGTTVDSIFIYKLDPMYYVLNGTLAGYLGLRGDYNVTLIDSNNCTSAVVPLYTGILYKKFTVTNNVASNISFRYTNTLGNDITINLTANQTSSLFCASTITNLSNAGAGYDITLNDLGLCNA